MRQLQQHILPMHPLQQHTLPMHQLQQHIPLMQRPQQRILPMQRPQQHQQHILPIRLVHMLLSLTPTIRLEYQPSLITCMLFPCLMSMLIRTTPYSIIHERNRLIIDLNHTTMIDVLEDPERYACELWQALTDCSLCRLTEPVEQARTVTANNIPNILLMTSRDEALYPPMILISKSISGIARKMLDDAAVADHRSLLPHRPSPLSRKSLVTSLFNTMILGCLLSNRRNKRHSWYKRESEKWRIKRGKYRCECSTDPIESVLAVVQKIEKTDYVRRRSRNNERIFHI